MKVGFGKEGLTINSKKFNPYSFSFKGMEVDVDKSVSQINPFTMLESLASLKKSDDEEFTNLDKVKALQSVLNRTVK